MLQTQNAAVICNPSQTIFGRQSMPSLSIWDFFQAKRQYNFEKYGWKNPEWAWDIFDKEERSLEQYQTFSRLKNLEKDVSVPTKESRYKIGADGNPIKKLDANGQPVIGQDGRPVFEYEEVITGYKTVRQKLSQAEIDNLIKIYIKSFKDSYDRFYARQYASINYNTEGIEKYKFALLIGKTIGEDVARQIAKRDAYNQQYKLQSAKKFAEEVKRMYKESFDRVVGIFENNPVLELIDAQILGQTPDNIFRSGELIMVNFTATNLGEKTLPSVLSISSSQDVIGSNSNYTFTVPSLSEASFSTPAMGQISNDHFAREVIKVSMGISNPGKIDSISSSFNVRKNTSIKLNDYAEIDRVESTLNYLTGDLSMVVTVVNPSSIMSPTISNVVLSVSNSVTVEDRAIEPIGAKSTKKVSIGKTGLDPLELISKNGITGSVGVKIANRTVHKEQFSLAIPDSQKAAIVKYFDALATKESTNSGNESRQERISKLISSIEESIRSTLDSEVKWTNTDEVERSSIGLLQKVYQESKRQGTLSQDAQSYYQMVGEAIAPMVKDLKSRGLFNDKKNKAAYLKEISVFAPKINTNPKKY
jgi:hypothetical protein